MHITKQRLVEIIKEELSEDMAGNPMFPVKDVEAGAAMVRGDDKAQMTAMIADILVGLEHNDAVDVMMGVAEQLGLNPPEGEVMDEPEDEYGKEDGNIGFVTTREGLEELIAAELAEILNK
jgi:hypothetical protein